MSKAILVMDMPISCDYCPCFDPEFYECQIKKEEILTSSIKPDWCPLKELPKKKNICDEESDYGHGYCNGWNGCINKILGGDKNEKENI